MRAALALMAALAALPAAAAGVPLPPPAAIVIPADAEPRIAIRVKNAELVVRLALGFDKALLLNATAAGRAGLKAFPFIGKRTVRNPLIPGGEAVFRGNIYSVTPRGYAQTGVPTVWVDKPIASDADGIMSAFALDGDRISFVQPSTPMGNQLHTMTRPGRNDSLMKLALGGEVIRVGFDLRSPDTVMNARAAEALESAGLVRRAGSVAQWQPFPGVSLPLERLTPVAGAKLLGLPMFRPAVRITEARAKLLDAKAAAGTSTVADEEDAITVNARRETKKRPAPWLLIGRDVLQHCARIEIDRPGKTYLLTCNI